MQSTPSIGKKWIIHAVLVNPASKISSDLKHNIRKEGAACDVDASHVAAWMFWRDFQRQSPGKSPFLALCALFVPDFMVATNVFIMLYARLFPAEKINAKSFHNKSRHGNMFASPYLYKRILVSIQGDDVMYF